MIYAGIGSRETPEDVLEYMENLAEDFARYGWTLRSGGARGADTAFERGCIRGDGQKRIYLASDATPEAMEHAAEFHPNWPACSPYAKKLHARNSLIMLGDSLNEPVDIVVCWTPGGFKKGGTAQALRIAEYLKISVFNLGAPAYGFSH